MNRIKCSVASCKFNEKGKACNADEIQVNNNLEVTDDMELGSFDDAKNATASPETRCETFAPRSDSQDDEDNPIESLGDLFKGI